MAQKIKAYHFGAVSCGKLKLHDRPRFQVEINNLEGQEVRLTVERKPAQRKNSSDRQRRYYFAVICHYVGQCIGCTSEEAHDSLKAEFNTIEKEINGRVIKIVASTETLSTIEREEYHAKIREWASMFLNCYIPLPNEISY